MKTRMKLLIMMTSVMAFAWTAQAQNTGTSKSGQDDTKTAKIATPGTFADKNNNGVCDNFEARQSTGHGRNFIDKDGDGNCDNRQKSGMKGSASGPGNKAYRQGKGGGNGNSCERGQGHRHRFGGNTPAPDKVK